MAFEQGKDQSLALDALENLRKRLLDLTASNRLISFRHPKNGSLRIIDELPDQLADKLLADTMMQFRAVPEPTEDELIDSGYQRRDPQSQKLVRQGSGPTSEEWAKRLGFSTDYEVPERIAKDGSGKHSDNAIQTLLYPHELEIRLKRLLQTAESAIQEMGANILYLAFGFLEWYESNVSDTARLAPLFLVPVSLRKANLDTKSRTYQYTLSYSGEDIIANLSLREKLKADFGMALPELDENTVPEQYFRAVKGMIDGKQARWRVRRYVSLALLNFNKLLMYLDLDPKRWPQEANIVDHPVVSRFLCGYGQEGGGESVSDYGFGEEYLIDEVDEIHAKYPLVDDADSSQHSALIDPVDGKNLVIEGPPGTGKSQTITNLIAAAMAQGNKVLFVAEKLAALEVVRKRLDAAGLGEFCLELHSHKSQKRKVLEEVDNRLKKHGRYRKPRDIEVDIARYEELKTALKAHAEKINRPWKHTGKTVHEVFMAATRYRNAIAVNPDRLHPEGYDGNNYDATTQRRNEDQVATYRKVYQAVATQLEGIADLREHPWCGARNSDLQIFDLDRVRQSLEAWQSALLQLMGERDSFARAIGCKPPQLAASLNEMSAFLRELEAIPPLQGDEILESLALLRGELLENAQRGMQLFLDIEEHYAALAGQVRPNVLEDLSTVDELVRGSQELNKLVDSGVDLGQLYEATQRLRSIHDRLSQVEEPMKALVDSLGPTAAETLTSSESGLLEFTTVIELIAALAPSCWKYRDEVFENEELDELLPELRRDIEELRELRGGLDGVFVLDALPSASQIRHLQSTLDAGGLFKWFKSDWRAARRQVKQYAVDKRAKLPSLVPRLGDLAEVEHRRRRLADNTRYREALGGRFQGIDTDLENLDALRGWYKRVRRKYGVGFGPKVTLGDAILSLSPSIAQAVRSLSERGLVRQVHKLIDDLDGLKVVFAPVAELRRSDTLLHGGQGIIPRLLRNIEEAIRACGPLAEDRSLSIEDLAARIEQIRLLRHEVEKWNEADLDRKLFHGRLAFQIGVGAENSAGLSALRDTLNLAARIELRVNNHALARYIYDMPNPSRFETLANHAQVLRSVTSAQDAAFRDFEELVRLDWARWTRQSGEQFEELMARNQRAIENGETLQNWLDYVRVREQLEALGLARLADQVEKHKVPIEEVEDAYQAGVFDVLAREILKEHPELGRFSGSSQEALRERFREYDNKLKRLHCEQIAWKIDQTRIPSGNNGARVRDFTEGVLLKHECGKRKGHLPIRQLLQRAGNALVALKPCFMMGPMSVAQYLAPGETTFDLVVMDEASQIKPQDALGAVARGAQLVVVGDPKQLPPTDFFNRLTTDGDDNNATAIQVSESILDATLPMFPARRLRWHYRSQHESLIAFSNHSFYESDLVLFPSPHKQAEGYGIHYSRVPGGCFVDRRNMEEANVISEAVREHFRHRPEQTLGIVAMNAEQRQEIERAIETLAKADPVFQEWLEKDATRHESLFIKNLENVQGDERDVVFVSMTYGPPQPGSKPYQRFGPINSDVGWRRLNVLFTRSKKRMHIFSSMGSDDIVVGPNSKRGVQALRDFLCYCETGILHKSAHETGRGPDSDFEIAVMTALRNAGFDCIPQVGVAGFFIDVAVRDPGKPSRYLMGIECDGATYHSAKSVRDRDRLRQTILERLGWNIRRIWSTDWFKNPHGVLRPIIRELHDLKSPVAAAEDDFQSKLDEIRGVVEEIDAERFTLNALTNQASDSVHQMSPP